MTRVTKTRLHRFKQYGTLVFPDKTSLSVQGKKKCTRILFGGSLSEIFVYLMTNVCLIFSDRTLSSLSLSPGHYLYVCLLFSKVS